MYLNVCFQISYEESLSEAKTVCFQAALLYTNSEGERRIRVHTMCLPVTASLPEVMHAADTEAIIGLLSKMAVDRSLTSNVADAREAFINATVDIFNAFKIAQNLPSGQSGQLIAPRSLALMPLYISALLKHVSEMLIAPQVFTLAFIYTIRFCISLSLFLYLHSRLSA